MPLSRKQHGVVRGIMSGGAITLLALPIAAASGRAVGVLGEIEPFHLWAGCASLPALCLAVAIGSLARFRFFNPDDIDGSGLTAGSEGARTRQAILQNTLEQAVLAIVTYGIAIAAIPTELSGAVPAAALLFVLGRGLFAHGYTGGAPARALGFALTFYPSVALLLASIVAWCISLFG